MKDQWVLDECKERLDKMIYTLAHLDINAGTYMKIQYFKRIMDAYVEQEGASKFMDLFVDLLYDHASALESNLPKEEEPPIEEKLKEAITSIKDVRNFLHG